jgi:hypothetical protein
MSIPRVAIIFDHRQRPETTGIYCKATLPGLAESTHFHPDDMAQIAPGEFDLYLTIDDGQRYALPQRLRPCAYWAIDTHLDFARSLERSRAFDFVFAAQRDGAQRLKAEGISTAQWLPLACDRSVHRRHEVPKRFDVCFVGNLFPGPRADCVAQIQSRYPNNFVGQSYFANMAHIYSESRIVFNRSLGNDVNMRVFEALACGSLLLTNDLSENGQTELFQDGVHLATYAGPHEMLEKIAWYLEHTEVREKIAAQGQAQVVAHHTYRHRMQQLLGTVFASRGVGFQPACATAGSSPLTPNPSPARGEVRSVACPRDTERLTHNDANPKSEIPNPESPAELPARSVSACLVSWKRPDNVRAIVAHLRAQPIIDDIVIWNNAPENLAIAEQDVTVIQSERNLITLGRYRAVAHARHDAIYTQDDDCLVYNIDELPLLSGRSRVHFARAQAGPSVPQCREHSRLGPDVARGLGRVLQERRRTGFAEIYRALRGRRAAVS